MAGIYTKRSKVASASQDREIATEGEVVPKLVVPEVIWSGSGSGNTASIASVNVPAVNNGLLVAVLAINMPDSLALPGSFAWNGKTLASRVGHSAFRRGVGIFDVVNPGTGIATITGTGTMTNWYLAVMLLSGVNQSTPSIATGTGTATNDSIALSADLYGLLVDAACCDAGGGPGTGTPNGAQTALPLGRGSYKIPTANPDSMSWVISSSYISHAAVSYNPA
ncbi:hypothetical protein EG834_17355 [bacterium]|nr:hypothetical protein [bacterium]